METRQWWLKIETYLGTVSNITYKTRTLTVMCKDRTSEAMT